MAQVDIQIASSGENTPDDASFKRWVEAALSAASANTESELSIRIVNSEESRELNHRYRNKEKPTNVLSFACELPEDVDLNLLGDLVICNDVVTKEAQEQHKSTESHWAHMVIHGTLHLLGYDHVEDAEAVDMEQLETNIMTSLGFNAPYEDKAID
ncbi:MAG: rRNA maturation RNase YbeY [Agarilytica sp.]